MATKLDDLIQTVNKSAKEELITVGLNDFAYKKIPFTSPRMNYCTFGGIPIGKLTEFYGEEHGGKTTTALDIVANYQNMNTGKEVFYIDAENSFDVDWAKKLNVDVDKMIIFQPKSQSAEQIFQIICDAVETGEVGLWVLDSIGALMSQQEWDKSMEEKSYGGISKPLTMFAKKIEQLMSKYECTGIGINQLRDKINSPYGGTTTVGGWGWKYLCGSRMEFKRGKFIDEKGNDLTRSAENPAGNIVIMSITKSKFCPATRRVGQYTLNYTYGIDYLKDLVDVAIKYDIIDRRGAWFSIQSPDTGEVLKDKIQGQANVYAELEANEELLKEVERLVDERMYENQSS